MNRLLCVAAAVMLTAAPAAAQVETWTIDSAHTSAQFAVRHMMVSTVRGTLGRVTGTVLYDPKDLRTLAIDATIDVAGLSTANQKRDDHLRSADFFDAVNHPNISFKSKRAEPAGDGRVRVIGDLTMRGVTREVTLDVEGPTQPIKTRDTYKVGAVATTRLNRRDFGLTWNQLLETGGAVVADEVQITIDIELNRKAAPTNPDEL